MQHQQGGAQYGAPPPPSEIAPFPSSANPRPQFPGVPTGHPEAAAPISSRPPPAAQNFGELAAAAAGSFHDEDALAAGEDAERGGTPGNRWPREETLALLKIRSEMDAAFRDASLKGPLWENVSRKLGELGYIRSAKKCKEKFENVHKYYKRTKEGRAGRQDGKSYRFFSQLEALHTAPGGLTIGGGSGSTTPTSMSNPIPALPAPVVASAPTWANIQPQQPPPVTAPPPAPTVTVNPPAATQATMPTSVPGATAGISFSSDTFTSSSYDSDEDEDTEEGGGGPSTEGRKRKRGSGSGIPGGSRKMMAFFEGLMMQVMEKQEAMQQRFLETIEKREQERMLREEAWKRQELARLNREHEILAQERAVAASRDSALIQFLQKIGGQPIQVPSPPPAAAAAVIPAAPPPRPVVMQIPVTPPPRPAVAAPPPPPPPQQEPPRETLQPHQQHTPPPPPPPQPQIQPPPPPPHELHHPIQSAEIVARSLPSSSCTELVPVPEQQELAVVTTPRGAFELGVSPSRWPKSEVHALIKLRSGLEGRYQEAGPKGPLWDEISSGMQRLGYNRSSKRCKEKWENINKYFKKVKESNKKRPEDAKTCPYFHQLDALYRKKNPGSTSTAGYSIDSSNPQATAQAPPPPQAQPVQAPTPMQIQHETERKSGDDNTGNQGGIQIQTSNGGGLPPSFFEGGTSGGATMNKPEDIMKELMEQQHRRQATMNHYSKMEETRNDHNMYQDDEDEDDEDDEDDDDDRKMVYKMQFERQNVGAGNGSGGGNASAKPAAAATAGSFLGMVQ